MKSTKFFMLVSLLLAAGCIVGDQLTTITIHPDGSADLVIFRSNLHSTESGEKGRKELADYKATFKSQIETEFARINEVGGKIVDIRWIRDTAPFSNIVRVDFPNAAALEKYGTTTTADGNVTTTTRFVSSGTHRRISLQIEMKPELNGIASAPDQNMEKIRQANANGFSENRIAVAGGSITASRGFLVAEDKQSAILDIVEIADAMKTGNGKAEFFLEWNVRQ